jgi:hypothetical protein
MKKDPQGVRWEVPRPDYLREAEPGAPRGGGHSVHWLSPSYSLSVIWMPKRGEEQL